jgi:UDP-N-acetylglucosamine--N-acetylmuramyl-(pentapeptide) pyrophosphoryl-undecaprenol N-acetylglucosamine transferase
MVKKRKIILATGGSGGHIFPAVAVAESLIERGDDVCIVSDFIYKKYAQSLKFDYEIIESDKNIKSFKGIKSVVSGLFKAISFLKHYKPNLVVAFGSYATLPTLIACILTRTPFILHEQNVYIGKTNKIFLRFAKKIMTSYPEIYGIRFDDMDKIIYTGNPIRKDIRNLKDCAYKYSNKPFNILITGGSLGAKFFSELLPKVFDKEHFKAQENLKIYHQVQQEYTQNVKKYYESIGLNFEISTFFENMQELLQKAHLVIGRSGNGTLTETSVVGRPLILIPLPTAANNHQEINARLFEKNKSAIVISEKNFKIGSFQKILFELIGDREKLEDMSTNIRKNVRLDANNAILQVINDFLN